MRGTVGVAVLALHGGVGLGKINPAVPKALIDKMNGIKQKIVSGQLEVPTTIK